MKTKFLAMLLIVAVIMDVCAETWTDPDTGYTWTYLIVGDGAEIYGEYHTDYNTYSYYSPTTPTARGDITIPPCLGGKPVTRIQSRAFYKCSELTSVSIPPSVTNIGSSAFYECNNLKSVYISDLASWCRIRFDSYRANPIEYAHNLYLNGEKVISLIIPESVTSVNEYAFINCTSLKYVALPGSVTNIGFCAFSGCKNLNSLSMGKGLKIIGIGAFSDCEELADLMIPDSVTTIDASAFSGCNRLSSVFIPSGLANIGKYAFSNCSSLMSFRVENGNRSYASGNGLLLSKDGKELISGVNGRVVIPDEVNVIGVSAFSGRTNLISVTLPNSIMAIESNAFSGCDNLTSVTMANGVTNIGSYAFSGCSRLEDVNIPDSVTTLGMAAFSDCIGLTDVVIGNGITNIEKRVFYDCRELRNISIPDGVTSIGDSAFVRCGFVGIKIPDSVTYVGGYAFFSCQSLNDLTIGNGVMAIGDHAFSDCKELSKVTIPRNVTRFGVDVFSGCIRLASITIPQSVCGKGLSATFPSLRPIVTNVVISSGATRIGEEAFSGCTNLVNITIPNSMASIGGYAFEQCVSLTNVVIPDGVESVGYYAFYNCKGLTDITMSNTLVNIGKGAFFGCNGLTSVTIPNSVTNIGAQAFGSCSQLERVCITSLADWCRISFGGPYANPLSYADDLYVNGEKITSVIIPVGITDIKKYAFDGYVSMTNVMIPDCVTNIDENAFSGCSGLIDVNVPNSVKRIGDKAFSLCSGLLRILLPGRFDGNLPGSVFTGCPDDMEIVYAYNYLDIDFDANGGVANEQRRIVAEGAVVGALPKACREGYSFLGWYTEKCGGNEILATDKVWKADTYFAHWMVNKYSVTFDANSGRGSRCDELAYGTTILPPIVTRDGYTFCGWNPEADECVPASNVIFTAQWTPNQYTVHFNANAGDGEIDPVGAIYDVEFQLPLNAFYRTGYTFAGWSETANGGLVFNDGMVVSNLVSEANGMTTLYALWAVNQYEVAFDSNGGALGESALPSVTNTQDYGSVIVAPEVLREGYAFIGWLPEVDATVPASNVTYTAQWRINQYEVAFDGNGGALGDRALPSVTNKQEYGSAIVAPEVSREGYTFVRWLPMIDATVPASNVTYTAQWKINQYEVAFDGNGGALGDRALPSMTNEQEYASVVIAPEVTREGYTFMGWQPVVLETVPASNVTYTAQWRVNQYEVAFDGNGGALGDRALPSVTNMQDYGSAIVPPSASRAGCTFEGWTPDVDATVPARDVSYTAQWKVWDITVESADVKIKDLYPDDYGRITNIVIGAEIEILPSGFFDGCDSIESITFLSPETDIGDNDLRKVGRLFDVQPDGYWIVQGALLGYKGECPGSIPDVDSIRRVIGDALKGCIALTDLTFTAESALTSVGTNAFKGCTELRALTLPPSLEEIGDEAFMRCSYLDNVIVPGSVKRVGARAFKNCTGFTGALIEYGVESLGDEAFYGDWRISEVDIPSSVTNIGVNAFGGDSSIIRVGLRGDVRKVSEIFSNYAILREATVKEGDGAIVDGLFEGCVELADVHFLGNSPELANDGRSIYSGTPETLTTYVATTSTGWDGTKGSHSLPQAWPLVGNRRSIAQWDLPTYLVLFDSNGGTLGVQSTYQYSERKFTLPPEPVQTGYKFAGWWTKPVGGLRVTDDTVFIEGVYRTLYAHWTKGRWVFLDPNGGTVENEFVTYIEQTEYGVLPTPVRTGYAFDGWSYNGKTVLATDELLADEDHVLKADWRKNKYIVTFDANSGDGGGVYELEYDSAIVPPVVVREGYMFLGWSPEVAATVPASNVTYAAQWKLNEYRVSLFVGNGEEGSPLVVTHGAKVGDIALPTRDGYVFGGWYDKPEDGKLVDGDTLIVGDMSLYAKWNSIYTVVFDANGGEGVMPDQPFVYGGEQSLSNVVFKATDRRFAGWATEKDGIVEYDDGEVVSNLTETANGVVTLYAVWEVWTDAMQTLDDIFGGDGDVSLDDHGTIVVTLTNDVSGTVEIPDYVGAVTIDLNGHNMVGDGGLGETALPGGPAIRIVKGDAEGDATQLTIVDTSEGEKGRIAGGGESAGIEVSEDAATGVKLDVEEGVGVFNGDGSEQELKPKLVGTGKVTVPKSWRIGQKVTWKATADKGSVFARWEGPLVDSLNLTKNERRNPSLAFAVPEGFDTNMVTAVFIPIDDDGLYSLGITQTEFELKEAVSDVWVTDDSQSYVTATASGLPTGLKFDAKKMTIAGTPTKSGVYWVQVKAKNASGYQWAENVMVTVSGDGKDAKEPKLTRTAYYPLTVICANDGGTVSGTGVYAEGKKVSVKATPAKGYVFAGWHETANSEKGTVNGVDGADYRSASLKVTVPETRYVFALFATKEDDADSLKVAVEDVTTEPDGTIGTIGTDGTRALDMGACVSSLSLPKLAVSGLPTGLKYDAKTLKVVGKATKPGVYTVTVKATNAAVTKATDASTATFRITVPNFECAALPGLKPETDAYGIVRSGVIFDDGLVDCTPADGWTVKVAGLPSGLKWDAKTGKIVGVPTAKAGSYTVTFTASKKGEAKQVATITLNVEALPDWVVGTFYGKNVARGLRGTWTCPQQFTVTISANGKISMKTVSPGEGAESRTAQLTECREDGSFAFSFHYASGRKGKDGYSEGDCAGIISPVAYGEDGALLGCLTTHDIGVCDENDSPFESKGVVYQSLYSRKPAVSGLPVFGKDNIRVVPVKSDYSDGEVTLKFGTKGAVTAAWSGTKPAATCSSYISPYARDADGTVHAKLWLTFLDKTRIDGYGDFVQTGFEFDLLIPASDKVSASDVDVVSARLTSIIAVVLNGDDVELVQQ